MKYEFLIPNEIQTSRQSHPNKKNKFELFLSLKFSD